MTDKYAVLGNPIAHSKSPQIHQAFAEQTGEDISYEAILASLDGFEAKVQELIARGYKGANVTVPFKLKAFHLVLPSNRALDAGAVNTLRFLTNEIRGDNTDGVGLVRDIQQNKGVTIAGKRVLLLGAGGAAEGVLHPLLDEAPVSLVIANRTLDKAQNMVKKILSATKEPRAFLVSAIAFDNMAADAQFDIVINATSTGLSDTTLPLPNTIFAEGCLAYDMMYGRETPFMRQARKNGAQVSDGLGMLVEQAAEAFYLWRGVRPQTAPVISSLRNSSIDSLAI